MASGKLERLGIEGARPVWVPGSSRQFVFERDSICYLYDLNLRREKRLFSVAPNTIYGMRLDEKRPADLFHADDPRRGLMDGTDGLFSSR